MALPSRHAIERARRTFSDILDREKWLAIDRVEATLDAMSRDETTTLDDMVEAVRAMKKRYQESEK